ncbi:hypothetical protein [Microbacterium sp. No. 7]|uniref:hypothetical protein n=1 Tax=Microbacterium sp. No. 7 TaxID=1714373 RepID=UPI0006D00989|nr:hypothetical protein [Microbacterium sp. No. 7]ALJ21828.1 hypothetical protein AOA12_18765 [Microbacterium sp. No. 7]
MNDRDLLLQRRHIVSVILRAVENAPEVLRICNTLPADTASAGPALSELLSISESESQIVLNMQIKMFTPHARARVRAELEDLDHRLARIDAP